MLLLMSSGELEGSGLVEQDRVEAAGEVAWVGDLAVGERFRAAPGAAAVRFTARRLTPRLDSLSHA